MVDRLSRYLHKEGAFKVALIETTQIGRDLFQKVQPSPIGLQLLAQGMTGALLLASGLKDEGTMLMSMRGNGPGESLTVEANTAGTVRGTMGNANLLFKPEPSLGLFQQTIGAGQLTVTRRTRSAPKTYQSVVDLVEGELALNFANYLLKSDQTRSGIQLGAMLDPDLGVKGAGGIMIQALPNADDTLLFILEQRLGELPPLGEVFGKENGINYLVEYLFENIPIQHMTDQPVKYHCPCSRRRMLQLLSGLPKAELVDMRASGTSQELNCSFCNQRYEILPEDLDVLLQTS